MTNWYKMAQEAVSNAQREFEEKAARLKQERLSDVRQLFNDNPEPMAIDDILFKLAQKFPERWTTYYLSRRSMSSEIMSAIREIKDTLTIQDNYRMPRGRKGGMGRAQHYNTYQLKRI